MSKEYKVSDRYSNLTSNLTIKHPTYIKQEPYVGEDGIYVPLEPYIQEGHASDYKCIMTKKMFVEAYNKWIKNDK